MKIPLEKILEMEQEKPNSANKIDRMVMDELLKMGFSYKRTGTNQLHDAIAFVVKSDPKSFLSTADAIRAAYRCLARKYGGKKESHQTHISNAIGAAFDVGNIDYLLDVFKNSLDPNTGRVNGSTFIMTVSRRILIRMEEENQLIDADRLRESIQESISKITSTSALASLCGIALALRDR